MLEKIASRTTWRVTLNLGVLEIRSFLEPNLPAITLTVFKTSFLFQYTFEKIYVPNKNNRTPFKTA